MIKDGYNQTVSQYVKDGTYDIKDHDFLSTVTSGFIRYDTPLPIQMIQSGSGGLVSYTINDQFEIKTMNGKTILSILNGFSAPLLPGSEFQQETVNGVYQGIIEKNEWYYEI